jgi:hypothetical protein
MNVFEWLRDIQQYGWSPAASRELRKFLQPTVKFSKSIRWPGFEGDTPVNNQEPRIKDYVDWEVVLRSGQDVRHHLDQIRRIEAWSGALVDLLPDFTSLLKDALDLAAELDGASEHYDLSYIDQPSISDHPQNQHFKDWTILIDLCRDAWTETAQHDPRAAAAAFNRWREIRYPIFRRLCLFAARISESVVPSDEALELLTQDRSWWLWSIETQRETVRLICALAARLDVEDADRLTEVMLTGPPRDMYKADLDDSQWKRIKERSTWLRIAKFRSCEGHMSERAQGWYATTSEAHPEFTLEADERDEFPSYISTGGPSGWRKHVNLPATRPELANALRERPSDDFWYEDNWRDLLQSKFRVAIGALLQLAQEGVWPKGAWQEAFQYLSDEKVVRRAWNRLHRALTEAPVEVIQSLGQALTWWLQSAANAIPSQAEQGFLKLIDRALTVRDWDQGESTSVTVAQAINHPVGHLTEALLRWWYRTGPKVGGLLPTPIRDRFSLLLTTEPTASASRVCLAAHLANLFIVDPGWTREYVLPYFSWDTDPVAAHSVWDAYLGNPNVSSELVAGFKAQFLETAKHYAELGEYGKQYAGLLAITLLELPEAFSVAEMRAALHSLGPSGIAEAAHRIAVGLANAGERREEYWTNRVKPLLERAWPKSAAFRSSEESCALAEVCIRAGGQFADALRYLSPWLTLAPECRLIAMHLAETHIPKDTPALALHLLSLVVDTSHRWSPTGLRGLLETIAGADTTLKDSQKFRLLHNYVEQYESD